MVLQSSRYTRYGIPSDTNQEWNPTPTVDLLDRQISILPLIEHLIIPKKFLEELTRSRVVSPLKKHRLYRCISKRSDIVLVVIQLLSKYPKVGSVCLEFFTSPASHWILLKWINMEVADRNRDSVSACEIIISKMAIVHDHTLSAVITLFSSRYTNVPWDSQRLPLLSYMNHLAQNDCKDESFIRSLDIVMTAAVNGIIRKEGDNLKAIVEIFTSSGANLMLKCFSQMPGCVSTLLKYENQYCTQIAVRLIYMFDDEIEFIFSQKYLFLRWLDGSKQPLHITLQLLTALAYRNPSLFSEYDVDHIIAIFLSNIGIQLHFCGLLVSINHKIRPIFHLKVIEHIILLMSKANCAQLSVYGTTVNMLCTSFAKSGTKLRNIALSGPLAFAKTSLRQIARPKSITSYATADGLAVVNWLYSIRQLKVREQRVDETISILFQKCWNQGFFLRAVNIVHWLSYTCPKQAEILAKSVNMNILTDFMYEDEGPLSAKRTRSGAVPELLFIMLLRRAEERLSFLKIGSRGSHNHGSSRQTRPINRIS